MFPSRFFEQAAEPGFFGMRKRRGRDSENPHQAEVTCIHRARHGPGGYLGYPAGTRYTVHEDKVWP